VNHDGRLGTNSVIPSNVPIQILTSLSFRMMAVSRNHTCALSLSDHIYCWGYAGDGQIGDGITIAPPLTRDSVLIPAEVVGGRSYQFVAAGGQHSCAITTAATGSAAYCWGFNASGELGEGTTTTRNVPTAVAGGLVLSAIAAGYTHTCALTVAGVAYCWGGNSNGQLGAGAGAGSNTPIAVNGGLVFAAITAGEAHSCGLTAAGALYCWGKNANGQLGDGTSVDRSAPTLVSGGLVFRSVSAGDQHTCAVTAANIVYCWGDNQFGQLGDGTLVSRLVPTRVAFQP
jgi:alpha-tubulin suppressor-like RCC1 family protein